jgi:DNA repair protein RecN (Recombination protein N)
MYMTSSAASIKGKSQLLELAVSNLGVVESVSVLFGSGMTAITGETGAGKTLLVTALELLTGGRSDSLLVGPHGEEAIVEGRFLYKGDEVTLSRVIPRTGRARSYLDGRISTVGAIQEVAGAMVEIHGQHGHTGLVGMAQQRKALDSFANIDLSNLEKLRQEEQKFLSEFEEHGGNSDDRTKELDLYTFQANEIDEAEILDLSEDERLREEELLLGDASGNKEIADLIAEALGSDGRLDNELSDILRKVHGRESLQDLERKVTAVLHDVTAIASDARNLAEAIDASPERLTQVQYRRTLLTGLRRKYGETLEMVIAHRDSIQIKIDQIEGSKERIQKIEQQLTKLQQEILAEEEKVGTERRSAAPKLAKRVGLHMRKLALPNAEIQIAVGSGSGQEVELLVSLNKGMPLQPLSKIASGGELARTMLSLRLILSNDPSTAIFDEVDAGIGGQVAHAVGAALGDLAAERQVLVVTHLAQVAAFADTHILVTKTETNQGVEVEVGQLDTDERVIEISRMLSGSPESESARRHAKELLSAAQSGQ